MIFTTRMTHTIKSVSSDVREENLKIKACFPSTHFENNILRAIQLGLEFCCFGIPIDLSNLVFITDSFRIQIAATFPSFIQKIQADNTFKINLEELQIILQLKTVSRENKMFMRNFFRAKVFDH